MNKHQAKEHPGGKGTYSYALSPLATAVQKNDFKKVDTLLDAGGDINESEGFERENLLVFCSTPDMFDYLINRGFLLLPDVLIEVIGSREMDKDVKQWQIKKLIKLGLHPDGETGDSPGAYRITPLVYALRQINVTFGAVEVIGTLLECGASPSKWCFNTKDYPLHHLISGAYNPFMISYRDWQNRPGRKNDQWTSTILSQIKDLRNTLDLLLQFGADLECRNVRGQTPLLSAAELSSILAIHDLCERGANILAIDNFCMGIYSSVVHGVGHKKPKHDATQFVVEILSRNCHIDPDTGEVIRKI